MKKLIFPILLVLMTTMVLADPFPYETSIESTVIISTDINNCVPFGDKFYCIAYDKNIYEYDITAGTLTNTGKNYTDASCVECNHTSSLSWALACDVYNDEIYCSGSSGGVLLNIWKYSPLNDFIRTELDSQSSDMTQSHEECRFRPGTDEFWCYGWETGTSYSAIRYYDISADDWVDVNDGPRSNYVNYLDSPSCDFRNSNELWCFGGYDNNEVVFDDIMKYEISGDTVTYYDSGLAMSGAFCRWFNDEFICYAGDTGAEIGTVVNASFIFNPDTELTTIYSDPFDIPINSLKGCSKYDDYTDYCVTGYLDGFDYDQNVEKITYGVPPITRRVAGGNNAFFVAQNLQKAAQTKQAALNPIEQFILNIRAAILRLFGHEGN